jgi:hypothetical protein
VVTVVTAGMTTLLLLLHLFRSARPITIGETRSVDHRPASPPFQRAGDIAARLCIAGDWRSFDFSALVVIVSIAVTAVHVAVACTLLQTLDALPQRHSTLTSVTSESAPLAFAFAL